jgi:ferredoxin
MAYVVTEICLDCRYTDCAAVCPTQAFHAGPTRLFINPNSCIDCDACVPECPVNAIFPQDSVPAQYQHDIALNASECEKFPVIDMKERALEGPSCSKSSGAGARA